MRKTSNQATTAGPDGGFFMRLQGEDALHIVQHGAILDLPEGSVNQPEGAPDASPWNQGTPMGGKPCSASRVPLRHFSGKTSDFPVTLVG